MLRPVLPLLCIIASMPLTSVSAGADTLSWSLRNDHPYTVYVRFFSKEFNRAWPGGENSYVFDDGRDRRVTLACNTGERICFGGFTKSRRAIWGVGEYGTESCEACCRICGDSYNTTDVFE